MLVLSRKIRERIIINGDIIVTVLDIHNGRVRLGIDAPQSINIRREELPPRGEELEKIKEKENMKKLAALKRQTANT